MMTGIRFEILKSILIFAPLIATIQALPPQGDDGCDTYLWRRCSAQNECDDEAKFKRLSWASPEYGNDPSSFPPAWQDYHYENYSQYECKVPPIDGCNVTRCVPVLSSGFDCTVEADCHDGEQCNAGKCGACYETPGYAMGACHQPQTFGQGGTPPYQEGESGCAGDHCHHTCSYDTKCVRILSDTTDIDLTATHNGLGPIKVTDESRATITRPGKCGDSDPGGEASGMRCAAPVHRSVTQRERTPDALRGHNDNVVVLNIYFNQGLDHYIEIDSNDLEQYSVRSDHWIDVGSVLPDISALRTDDGIIAGKGVYAFGLGNWHFGRKGLVTCEARYTDDAPLHTSWAGVEPDTSLKMSTLQTRVCTRWQNRGPTVVTFGNHEFGDDERWCTEWGASSTFGNTLPFSAKCEISGSNVSHIIPNEEQRDLMLSNISSAYNRGSITGAPMLRIAFHDAAPYSPPNIGLIKGGPQGCMRFEHVQGNEGNSGLHFTIDTIGPSVGCGGIWSGVFESCPWSVADVLQFVGAFASAEMMNTDSNQLDSIVSDLRWGRHDAPGMFCTGELQLAQPDHDGGHLAGFLAHGSSVGGSVTERLAVTFESTRVYFEDRLGLAPKHWVAILGAHSVGGVRGLIQARNTRFMFDKTPTVLDNKYYERLALAAVTNFASLCPMNKKMGHAHWWGPGESAWSSDNDHWLTLLDTDVAMVLNPSTLSFVQEYASDEEVFLKRFREAFLIIGELGYASNALFVIPSTTTPGPIPTTAPTLNSTTEPTFPERTSKPSNSPVSDPTRNPTMAPTLNPTAAPTLNPTAAPIIKPTPKPSNSPVSDPTRNPTMAPTLNPTAAPTIKPTPKPSNSPVSDPTRNPTMAPTLNLTTAPTINPTMEPTFTERTPEPTSVCPNKHAEVLFTIQTDRRGAETQFKVLLRKSNGKFKKKVLGQKKFPNTKLVSRRKCIQKKKCYKFIIADRGRDGICCAYGMGWYKLTFNENVIKLSTFTNKRRETKRFGFCK